MLNTGRHILTAAQCVDGDGDNVPNQAQYFVRFDLAGGPITLTVPSANVAIHPDWDGEVKDGNDVAILTLDELAPSGQTFGYGTYTTNDEAGKAYATAGYGATGTGTTGDNSQADVGRTEIQRLKINAASGQFQLGFNGQAATLDFNANAADIAAAIEGFDGVIDAEVRRVAAGGPHNGSFEIEFRDVDTTTTGFSGLDVPQLTATPLASFIGTVDAQTLVDGGAAGRGKRSTANVFDGDGTGQMTSNPGTGLRARFDANAGEGATGPGDSGGPAFIGNLIAGINSFTSGDNVFNDFDVFGRVSAFAAFINDTIDDAFELVVDMSNQPGGNDGIADSIELLRNGDFLEVLINATTVFTEAFSRLTAITILGSSDPDNLTVDYAGGDPIPAGGLTFDGEDPTTEPGDTITVANAGSRPLSYTPDAAVAGSGSFTVSGTALSFSNVEGVSFTGVDSFTFVTPGSTDVLTIDSPVPARNRISGTSDGIDLTPFTFSGITNFTLDTATNDGASPGDFVSLGGDGLVASGLQNFTINTGAGDDTLSITSDLVLPVPGGRFTFNAGGPAGPDGDRLLLAGDTTNVGSFEPDANSARDGIIVEDGASLFFTDLEDAEVRFMSDFRIVTPNTGDTLTIEESPVSFASNRISGRVGQVGITRLTFALVNNFTVDAASRQTDSSLGDSITITNPGGAALVAAELRNFTVNTGPGNDVLTINAVDLRLPFGGVFSFNSGTGLYPDGIPVSNHRGLISLDRIVLNADVDATLADVDFTLADGVSPTPDLTPTRSRLSIAPAGSGAGDSLGSIELTAVEAGILTGGAGANILDASAFTGAVILSGMGGNDTLRGGSGNNTLDGGDDDDTLYSGDDRFGARGAGALANNLQGGGGVNLLLGGAGNDTLHVNLYGTATLLGGTGNDTFIITNATGTVVDPAGGIVISGGGEAGDRLVLQGGGGLDFNEIYLMGPDDTAGFEVVTPNNLGLDGGDRIGVITFDGSIVTTNNVNFFGPTLTQVVRFAGLRSIEDTMSANHFDVKGTSVAHPIAVVAGTDLAGGRIRLTVDGNPFTALNFANKALPTLSAADGTALVPPPIVPPPFSLAFPPVISPPAPLSGLGAGTPGITPAPVVAPTVGVPAAVAVPPLLVAPGSTLSFNIPPVTITPVAGQFAASRRPGRRFPKAVRRIARRERAARFRIPGASIQRPRN